MSRPSFGWAKEFVGLDLDPKGGFTIGSPNLFLFTDLRHIDPANVRWLSPDGKKIPVAGPPEPPVEALADTSKVPHGLRLVSQPADQKGPFGKKDGTDKDNLPTLVIYDNGLYRS